MRLSLNICDKGKEKTWIQSLLKKNRNGIWPHKHIEFKLFITNNYCTLENVTDIKQICSFTMKVETHVS